MNLFVRKRTVKASNKEKIKGHDIISNNNNNNNRSLMFTHSILCQSTVCRLAPVSLPSGNATQTVFKEPTTRFTFLEKLNLKIFSFVVCNLSVIGDVFPELSRARVFTKVDARHGYWHLHGA